jgi:hypothetical protein
VTTSSQKRISLSSMPSTRRQLFGRDHEISLLDDAWQSETLNVLCLTAWGGVGKTALLNRWLSGLGRDDYGDAETVFGWSFYTQGTQDRVVSSDLFMESALAWFGDEDPGRGSPWDRSMRLAEQIRNTRTLLVLDGLEPLQFPPGAQEGRIRDNALAGLLTDLATANNGLCLVSTRLPVANLEHLEGDGVRQHELEPLAPEAGADLLLAMGVRGQLDELQGTSAEFGGHALALTLLGSFLDEAFDGDIARRSEIGPLEQDSRYGGHAQRILEAYEQWLGDSAEVELLNAVGLFDRPIASSALDAALGTDSVDEWPAYIAALSRNDRTRLLTRLRRIGLLSPADRDSKGVVDAHPLIREHFGESFRRRRPNAWKSANNRLFEYHRRAVKQEPKNLEEMEVLFQAMIFACRAGRHGAALHQVYVPRIMRGDQNYAAVVLGAHSALLFVLSHFVEGNDWRRPISNLSPRDRLAVLLDAGINLTATRGYAATEVEDCYDAAAILAEDLRDEDAILHIELGRCRLARVRGDLATSLSLAQRIERSPLLEAQPDIRPLADRALASTYFYLGRFTSVQRYATAGASRDQSRLAGLANARRDLNEPIACCLGYEGLACWMCGEPDAALDRVLEAEQRARGIEHPHTLAVVLLMVAMVHHFRGSHRQVRRTTETLIAVCAAEGFSLWRLAGEFLHGWSDARTGLPSDWEEFEKRLNRWTETGASLFMPYWLGLAVEADQRHSGVEVKKFHAVQGRPAAVEVEDRAQVWRLIDRAVVIGTNRGETWWHPELLGIRGDLLAGAGNAKEAEDTYTEAFQLAATQGSRGHQLRAAVRAARLANALGTSERAAYELEAALMRIRGGETTVDVRAAMQLLDEMS